MMCLGVFLLGSSFFGTLSFLDFLEVYFLCQISSPSLFVQISFQFLVFPLLLLALLLKQGAAKRRAPRRDL